MRLIDADALIDRLDYCVKEGMGSTIAFTFKHMVEAVPTIEPKQGEWIPVDNGHHVRCSECGRCGFASDNFCSNCGADMRKGADDEV